MLTNLSMLLVDECDIGNRVSDCMILFCIRDVSFLPSVSSFTVETGGDVIARS